MKILDETRGELLAIHGYKGRKSNSCYRNKCLAIISRLQVMMELHTYDLKEGNERHVHRSRPKDSFQERNDAFDSAAKSPQALIDPGTLDHIGHREMSLGKGNIFNSLAFDGFQVCL